MNGKDILRQSKVLGDKECGVVGYCEVYIE